MIRILAAGSTLLALLVGGLLAQEPGALIRWPRRWRRRGRSTRTRRGRPRTPSSPPWMPCRRRSAGTARSRGRNCSRPWSRSRRPAPCSGNAKLLPEPKEIEDARDNRLIEGVRDNYLEAVKAAREKLDAACDEAIDAYARQNRLDKAREIRTLKRGGPFVSAKARRAGRKKPPRRTSRASATPPPTAAPSGSMAWP